MQSLSRFLRFHLERWIQRGAFHQLVLMTAVIGGVALAGGFAAYLGTDHFQGPWEAVWWGFLRLTDPGYLGDDQGTVLRTVSTVVTVLGYVLFMGSLIAIMTQWLSRTVRGLESGLTPIAMADHVVILGWTNRTPEIVHRLLNAHGRLQRFLERRGVPRLRIVVQSEDVGAESRLGMREELGDDWDENRIFLRSGSSQRLEDLARLDLARASVVILPGADFELGGAELSDTRVLKSLLTMDGFLRDHEERPLVVAEVFDVEKISVAHSACAQNLEIVASESVIGQLISQSIRHRRLGKLLLQLLSHREGCTFYVRGFPELAGESPALLDARFPNAVVIGAVRPEGGGTAHLNPEPDFVLREDDLLVLVARTYDDCELVEKSPDEPPPLPRAAPPTERNGGVQRVLILGWSRKVASIVSELSTCAQSSFEITVLSVHSATQRERSLSRLDYDRDRVRVVHLEADFATRRDLALVRPETYDDVVFLASGWMESSEDADARTLIGYVQLKALLEGASDPPEVLIELLDPDNALLIPRSDDVLLISPRVLSHLLAHVSLRPELNAVFDALFRSGGMEIALRSARSYGLLGRTIDFPEVQRQARARGEVALGVVIAGAPPGQRLALDPPRDRQWTLNERDEVVVLGDDEAAV